MKRKPIPPTNHLRAAIRKIDRVVWKLYDEQLEGDRAYILAVSRSEKREILRLYRSKFTALTDQAVMLEGRLPPKERRRAIRLSEYEGEMASLHAASEPLRSRMESAYMHLHTFKQ